ncbi:MAG: MauE/DoxX family redox-associated membrane protein [Gammaproteobacteria bacterium]
MLTGAMFKLLETSPRLLPSKTILAPADDLGINLYWLLATLIAAEFLAIAVMVLVARLARAMAIFVLSVFCLILIGEMAQGNITSCGCFGSNSPPPWAILMIDGGLLVGVLFLKPLAKSTVHPARWPVPAAIVLMLIGFATSFAVVIPAGRAPDQIDVPQPPPDDNAGVNPDTKALPGYWFANDLDAWIGQPWREIELFAFMPRWPSKMDSGTRYVVFYRRTCEHCQEMFENDLTDPLLGAKVTAIEVPEEKNLLRPDHAWFMPKTDCELMELPLGCDWIIQTPLALRIENGIVTCATEGDHKQCLELDE